MAVAVIRLGSPRRPGEGVRLGTVRRPPRGVPKTELAARDFYDVWLPLLSPSAALVASVRASDDEHAWSIFVRRFRREMSAPEAARMLDLLALFSHQTDFALGCYCAEEARCHRSLLRELLVERGAELA